MQQGVKFDTMWFFTVLLVFYGIFRSPIVHIYGVGYSTAEESRVEHFVIIVEGF